MNAFAIYNIAHNFEKYIISIISCYRSDNASYFYCKFVSMYNLCLMKEQKLDHFWQGKMWSIVKDILR